jgi:hypothetical protein
MTIAFVNISGYYSTDHPSQKCHANMGPILNGYEAMDGYMKFKIINSHN